MWIDRGYLHLLNNETSTLTLSDVEFGMVEDKFGDYIEKSVNKCLENHDRQPGKFREGSLIKAAVEEYRVNESNLYQVSSKIARELFKKRDYYGDSDKTALFIMHAGESEGKSLETDKRNEYIVGMELKREYKYQISSNGGRNSVIQNPMLLPKSPSRKTTFFTIKLNDLSVSVFEDKNNYIQAVLGVELGDSFNVSIHYARECIYNTLTKIEDKLTTYDDMVNENNQDKILLINQFESYISKSVIEYGGVDFIKLSEEIFALKMQRKEFIQRLKKSRVNEMLIALTRTNVKGSFITYVEEKEEPKRVTLANGIEVIIPIDLEELKPIVLQEVDGELVEICEA